MPLPLDNERIKLLFSLTRKLTIFKEYKTAHFSSGLKELGFDTRELRSTIEKTRSEIRELLEKLVILKLPRWHLEKALQEQKVSNDPDIRQLVDGVFVAFETSNRMNVPLNYLKSDVEIPVFKDANGEIRSVPLAELNLILTRFPNLAAMCKAFGISSSNLTKYLRKRGYRTVTQVILPANDTDRYNALVERWMDFQGATTPDEAYKILNKLNIDSEEALSDEVDRYLKENNIEM